MGTGDTPAQAKKGDDSEIERIIQEIEELEKTMDTPAPAGGSDDSAGALNTLDMAAREATEHPESAPEPTEALEAESTAKPRLRVVEARPRSGTSTSGGGNGDLALKIAGCTNISLEFAHSGVTISLQCTDDGLSITTDQGAEFRLPFKRAA